MISLVDWTDREKRYVWLLAQPYDVNTFSAACFADLANSPDHADSALAESLACIKTTLAYALGTGTWEAANKAERYLLHVEDLWGGAEASAFYAPPATQTKRSAAVSAVGTAVLIEDRAATYAILIRIHARQMAYWRVLHRLNPQAMPLELLDLADTDEGTILVDLVAEHGEEQALAETQGLKA